MTDEEANSLDFYLFRGRNHIAFKPSTLSDVVDEQLTSATLWGLYAGNSRRHRHAGLSRQSVLTRFITQQAQKELAEVGLIHWRPSRLVRLPRPSTLRVSAGVSFKRRRSAPTLSISWNVQDVSNLLHYACGITVRQGSGKALRAYPSPGALYPNDLALFIQDVKGLDKGLYMYEPYTHRLGALGCDSPAIRSAFMNARFVRTARLVAILVNHPFRTIMKYGEIGYKLSLLDAGILLENLVMVSTALGKNNRPWESYYDVELNRAMGIDGRRAFVSTTLLLG